MSGETIILLISAEEQLDRWVQGESTHRHIESDGAITSTRGDLFECCPDFSCCRPELLQPAEVRTKYPVLSDSEKQELDWMFLQAFLKRRDNVTG